MTSDACPAAPSPSHRPATVENGDLLIACMAALPLGLVLDHWFGLLPALADRCGGSDALLETLQWHWRCMPATCLMMLFAAPAWIGVKILVGPGAPRRRRWGDYLAALGCHVAMLAGMICALGVGPPLASLVGSPWTGGAAIGAMTVGMVSGFAAALLCESLETAVTSRWI